MDSPTMMVQPKSNLLANIRTEKPLLRKQFRRGEAVIQAFLFFCGFLTIFTTIAIVIVLGRESLLLLTSEYVDGSGIVHQITPLDFVNTIEWQPHRYEVGIAPLVSATVMSSVIAMLVALPLGTGVSHLSERIRIAAHAEHAQADPGSAGGHPYGGLRLLRAAIHDSAAAQPVRCFSGRNVQSGVGWDGDGDHDPAARRVDERRCAQCGAALPARSLPTVWGRPSWKPPFGLSCRRRCRALSRRSSSRSRAPSAKR